MLAPLTKDVLSSRKCGIFYTFGVNLEVFGFSCVVCFVNAVVQFVTFHCLLGSVALLALELEVVPIALGVLSRFQHVVTLSAKAHAFELICSSVLVSLGLRGCKIHFY